jgi:hypothetical protein
MKIGLFMAVTLERFQATCEPIGGGPCAFVAVISVHLVAAWLTRAASERKRKRQPQSLRLGGKMDQMVVRTKTQRTGLLDEFKILLLIEKNALRARFALRVTLAVRQN